MLTTFVFFLSLLARVPIFAALLLGTLAFLTESDLAVLFSSLPLQLYGSIEQNGLLAIPLFMLVGELMNQGGLTLRLMRAADVMIGNVRGGLAYVNLITNAMAASILGSAVAQIAVMSRLMIPTMEQKGYNKSFAAAVTISGGLLGPIIPPSMLMIIYGVISYQPVSTLFIAGILPGLVILTGFALTIAAIGFFKGFPDTGELEHTSKRADLLAGTIPAIIPVSVIIGIITGVMTPTEAGALASILALLLGVFVYKNISLSSLPSILVNVSLSTANITVLIACASVFGWSLSFESVPDMLIEAIQGLTSDPLVFLLLINATVIVLGMFLESISVMIVIVPILAPASLALGIDPIHFGIVISLATLVGLVTPPVGPGLFIASANSDIRIGELFRAFIPFLFAMLACILLISAVPEIALWLPAQFN